LEAEELVDQFINSWQSFALLGLKKKFKFPNTSLILVKIWINVLKEMSGSSVQSKIIELCKSFLAKFIQKTLKHCSNTKSADNEFYEGVEDEQKDIFDEFERFPNYCNDDILFPLIYTNTKTALEEYSTHLADKAKLEHKLGWLINLLSSFIDIKNFSMKGSWSDPKVVDICALVFKLISSLLHSQQTLGEYLELAFIKFCASFRREALAKFEEKLEDYFSEEVEEANPYNALEAVLRLADIGPMAELIFKKLINDLAQYFDNRRICEQALSKLKYLVSEPSISRNFLTLPVIQTLLQRHFVCTCNKYRK